VISEPRDLYGIWGFDGQNIFIAHGSHHGVYTNRTGSWTEETFPGSPCNVYDVWGFESNDVFAVGMNTANSTTHLFHFDGESWSEIWIQTGLLAGKDLWGPSGDNLFMTGSDGSIAHFDGQNLTTMYSGGGTQLWGLWGTGSQNVYACGSAGLVLHFDGDSWQPEATPPSEASYRGVWGSGPDDVYVVGDLNVLHFNGFSWGQVQGLPFGGQFRDVFGSSSTDVYLVGVGGLVAHFDGETWVDESISTDGNFISIWGGLRREGDQHWSSAFGDQGQGGVGFDDYVCGLQLWDGGIALGGNFTHAGTDTVTRLAHWNGNTVSALYQTEGPNETVFDLIIYDGELIAGGRFTMIDGMAINAVAAWDGTQWHQLGAGLGTPTDNGVVRLTLWDGKLVAVGDPSCTAFWDGTSWTSLGGFEGFFITAVEYQGDLLAGGQLNNPELNGVLRYNGTGWEGYHGSNLPEGGYIYDLEPYQNSLLVGGFFSSLGEVTDARGLVQWSGSGWSKFGGFMGEAVIHLGRFQDDLVVSGMILEAAEGVLANNVALYNGSEWKAMGSGLSQYAWNSLVDGDRLTFGGMFTTAGALPAFRVATWHEADLAIPIEPTSGPAQAGQDYTFSINIEGDPGAHPVYLHYRLRDDDPYHVAVMTPSVSKTGTYEATVPGDFFGELGFQFFVSTVSSSGPVFFPASAPAEPAFTSVVMVDESLGVPVANQYVMIGIPFVPDKSLEGLLTDAFGPYDQSQWRFGRWEPLTSSYREFPNMAAQAPGRGYWLIQKTPRDLPATGVSTSTVGSVVLTLEPGWNQIATPYNFSIPWSAVTPGPNVANRLVARSGGGYMDVNQMNPWQGYWVINTGLNASFLTIPPTELTKQSTGPEARDSLADDVLWAITLDVEHSDRYDRQNIAAVAPNAVAGIDSLDCFEPPALPGDVSLLFEISENEMTHSLSRDMRGPFADGVAWDLVLRFPGGGLVDLDVSGAVDVPGDHEVHLLTQDGSVDLRQVQQVVVLVGSGGETRLSLVVGEPEYVQEQERCLPRPFALRPAYPNPFNPKTTLGFTLPRISHVNLDIFDVRGRLVRHLVDDSFEAGLHEVPWNGLDDGGRSVSAGVYFSRMQTRQFQQIRKVTLVR